MPSKGINKVILVGNLGQAPELKQLTNGKSVANLSIATSESWKDKNTGQQREKTEWHRIVMFGHLADIAGRYLTKGSKIYVEGRLQTRKWQDNSGIDRYTTEITANEMQMLDSKRGGEMANPQPVNNNHSGSGYVQVQHHPTTEVNTANVSHEPVPFQPTPQYLERQTLKTTEQSPDNDDWDNIPF